MSEYTSNLLCHFVGRSKKTEDERFQLLVTIIKGGRLIANLSSPNNLQSFFKLESNCENAGEVFSQCDCVCFCDIPNEALTIHTGKYSQFGMGFEKLYVAERGARPVMYVPQNFPIVERGDHGEKSKSLTPRMPQEYYPYLLSTTTSLLTLLELSAVPEKMLASHNGLDLTQFLSLLDTNVTKAFLSKQFHPMVFSIIQGMGSQMAYVKLYDTTLPDDHPDNYYMEREWRSLHNIEFGLNDIKTIYLPNESYQERFMNEFPEYSGSFYFLDKQNES